MQSKRRGNLARLSFGVVLAAVWVAACDADDKGLFSDEAPLSPANGGSAGSSMVQGSAGSGGMAGTRAVSPGAGTAGQSDATDDDDDDTLSGGGDSNGPNEPPDTQPPPAPVEADPVDFQFSRCERFIPCGGNLNGTWVYTAGCIELGDLGLSLQDDGCEAVNGDVDAQVGGTLRFDGNTVERDGAGSGTGLVRLPTLCTLAIGGCPGLRALIENDDDACDQTGAECVCNFVTQETDWSEDTFQSSGDVFTLSSGRTFEYCVAGNELTYRETSADGTPQDSALHVLTKR